MLSEDCILLIMWILNVTGHASKQSIYPRYTFTRDLVNFWWPQWCQTLKFLLWVWKMMVIQYKFNYNDWSSYESCYTFRLPAHKSPNEHSWIIISLTLNAWTSAVSRMKQKFRYTIPVMGKSKSWFDLNRDWITYGDLIWVVKDLIWTYTIRLGFDLKFTAIGFQKVPNRKSQNSNSWSFKHE